MWSFQHPTFSISFGLKLNIGPRLLGWSVQPCSLLLPLLQLSLHTGFFPFLTPTHSLCSQDVWMYGSLSLHFLCLQVMVSHMQPQKGAQDIYRETKFIILTGSRESESPHCQGTQCPQSGLGKAGGAQREWGLWASAFPGGWGGVQKEKCKAVALVHLDVTRSWSWAGGHKGDLTAGAILVTLVCLGTQTGGSQPVCGDVKVVGK